MNDYTRTVYVELDDSDQGGWTIEGPDAAAMFVRWLGKDAVGRTLAVMLDDRYRVVGCDVVAGTRREALRLTTQSVLRHIRLSGARRFILASRPSDGNFLPTRRQAAVVRMIGLSTALANTPMIDHVVVGNRGYWSAWAQDAVDW